MAERLNGDPYQNYISIVIYNVKRRNTQFRSDTALQYRQKLIQRVGEDNDKSVEALTKKAGIQVITVGDSERERWNTRCAQMRDELAGEIYPQSLLEQVNALLKAYRSSH